MSLSKSLLYVRTTIKPRTFSLSKNVYLCTTFCRKVNGTKILILYTIILTTLQSQVKRFAVTGGKITKGQLILKANSTIFIWTKKRTKIFLYSCPKIDFFRGFFFQKYYLKWAFSDILIHFQWSNLIFVEFFLYSGIVRFYQFLRNTLTYHISKFYCMKCS